MSNVIFVFAREPQAGMVKTRLRGALSDESRLGLYKAFLKDTLELTKSLKGITRILAFDAGCSRPEYLENIGKGFIFYKQKGKDLGERMLDAFRHARKIGGTKILIVGTDSPNLPKRYIGHAFRLLEGNDVVLGPSADGGYYLIGLKRPSAAIFRGIKWGGGGVLGKTVSNARGLGKKTALLPEWYDVDCALGLTRLQKDLKRNKRGALWTRKFLRT